MYDVEYDDERLVSVTPRYADVPEAVVKRTIADLADWPYPRNQLVPLTEVVHDRLNVEVFRGCTRGCRFCQAGMITRPVRERPEAQVRTMVAEGLRRTGYDEVSLTSLSTADFSGVERVVADVVNDPVNRGQVSVSLPSLRVDAFTVGIAATVGSARRTGLTFAPEAGSWRLRTVINKLITEDDLYGAVESAYSQGWRRMKLYFLTGLPTEQDVDTLGIAELAKECVAIGKRYTPRASVTVSVGGFVPKPHTPFQWFGQNTVDELQRKVFVLRDATRSRTRVQLKWHDPGPRSPRASRAAAIAASAQSSSTCGGPAAPSRSGPSASTSRGGTRRWPRMASRSTGTCIATAPRTRCCPGRTSPPACTPTSCGTTGRPHSRVGRRGLPLDALLRLRRLHGLRDRARRGFGDASGRGEPGHRAGPLGRRAPDAPLIPCGRHHEPPACPVHQASARSASRATATWLACSSAPPARRDPPRLHRGVLAPAPHQLRPRTLDGL